MFGHATLQPGIAAAVLARTQAGVTAHLASVAEPSPVADLPIDHHRAQCAKAARLLRSGRGLELQGKRPDLLLQSNQNGLTIREQLFHPGGDLERPKAM